MAAGGISVPAPISGAWASISTISVGGLFGGMRESVACLAGSVIDNDGTRERVRPPPPEQRVQGQPGQYRAGQVSVDQGHFSLGAQHRIAQGVTGADLAPGQGE